MKEYDFPVRVYYEDTDAGGVVYHPNYLKYAERARTEMLRSLGVTNPDLLATCGILIIVKAVEIDYKKVSVLDDSLIVHTEITEIGASSMTTRQTIGREKDEICVLKVVLVCVSGQTGRPVRWPEQVRGILTS